MTTRLSQEVIGVEYDKIPDFIAYLAKEGLETGGTGAKIRPVVSCKGTTCQYGLIDTYALSQNRMQRNAGDVRNVRLKLPVRSVCQRLLTARYLLTLTSAIAADAASTNVHSM